MLNDKRMEKKLYNNRKKYFGMLTIEDYFFFLLFVFNFSTMSTFLKLKNHN